MSELINNRKQRREQLKKIILDIHANENPDELKVRFRDLINKVGPGEIAEMEQELIDEGLQVEEVQKLCDVHASLFKESLLQQEPITSQQGHPIDTFKKENRAIEDVLTETRKLTEEMLLDKKDRPEEEILNLWKNQHDKLIQIDKHYSRKENILFPYLEKRGINGPPSVMWAVDDEIRDQLKDISSMLQNRGGDIKQFINENVRPTLTAIEEMIFKEENILFPMCMENLSDEEWIEIYKQSDDIGYSLITPEAGWEHADAVENKPRSYSNEKGQIGFETGNLTPREIELIFNSLPVDITFVDEKDEVRYFSHGQNRIFARTKAIIGRKVNNCHPPDSVHVVNTITDEFKSGKRDKADFWLEINGMFVYITYFPLRDESGKYLGTIEVTQNVKKLRELRGEKRILDE